MDVLGGNETSYPVFVNKGEEIRDVRDYQADADNMYQGDLIIKNETKWFEIEW